MLVHIWCYWNPIWVVCTDGTVMYSNDEMIGITLKTVAWWMWHRCGKSSWQARYIEKSDGFSIKYECPLEWRQVNIGPSVRSLISCQSMNNVASSVGHDVASPRLDDLIISHYLEIWIHRHRVNLWISTTSCRLHAFVHCAESLKIYFSLDKI